VDSAQLYWAKELLLRHPGLMAMAGVSGEVHEEVCRGAITTLDSRRMAPDILNVWEEVDAGWEASGWNGAGAMGEAERSLGADCNLSGNSLTASSVPAEWVDSCSP